MNGLSLSSTPEATRTEGEKLTHRAYYSARVNQYQIEMHENLDGAVEIIECVSL